MEKRSQACLWFRGNLAVHETAFSLPSLSLLSRLLSFTMWSNVQERWENHIILRSSIIFGPQAPNPVSRTLFLQFIERTLKGGKPTKFFSDEYRSPIYVQDIIQVVRQIIRSSSFPHRSALLSYLHTELANMSMWIILHTLQILVEPCHIFGHIVPSGTESRTDHIGWECDRPHMDSYAAIHHLCITPARWGSWRQYLCQFRTEDSPLIHTICNVCLNNDTFDMQRQECNVKRCLCYIPRANATGLSSASVSLAENNNNVCH